LNGHPGNRNLATGNLAYARALTGTTNFNPDHTSSTAHTFTSTNPDFNPKSRMLVSSRSVATPEDFFGHEIQIMPSSFKHFLHPESKLLNAF